MHIARDVRDLVASPCSRKPFDVLAPAKLNQSMKVKRTIKREAGKVGWVVLWLLGVPIPVLLLLFLLRGCT